MLLLVVLDRPKGFQKLYQTAAGPKMLTYPLDYGYMRGIINHDDGEEADVFIGTGDLYGRFMKGKRTQNGKIEPDERKWYAGLTEKELLMLKTWWDQEHDKGITWDWINLPSLECVYLDMLQVSH